MTGSSRPGGLGAQITAEQLAVDPYPLFERLRREEPLSWVPALGMWLVTRYDDVVSILRDPERFSTDSPHSTIRDTFGRQMLSSDGPDQRRYKSACLPSFSGKSVREHWTSAVTSCSRELVDSLSMDHHRERRADLMATVAESLSLRTMGLVLGLPNDDLQKIRAWYDDFAAALANFSGEQSVRARARDSAQAFRRSLVEQLRAAAQRPRSATLISQLACSDTEPLSQEEILNNLMIVLFGGVETTEAMIGNAAWAVLSHAETLERAKASSNDLVAAIEESLRFEPAVQSCTRHVTGNVTLHGFELEAGEIVQCMLGAANRDPEVFADPETFDPERASNRRHLAFGLASHFCLGAQLARTETKAALSQLLDRLPRLRLDPERPSRPFGHEFRKPRELWVKWD